MTQYMIAFDDGAMTFPEEELPDVARAAQAVAREARDAGVWLFSAGLEHQVPSGARFRRWRANRLRHGSRFRAAFQQSRSEDGSDTYQAGAARQ